MTSANCLAFCRKSIRYVILNVNKRVPDINRYNTTFIGRTLMKIELGKSSKHANKHIHFEMSGGSVTVSARIAMNVLSYYNSK